MGVGPIINSRVDGDITSTYKYLVTYHSGSWVPGSIGEGARKRRRTALIVVRIRPIVNGRVDGDRPHGRRVAVAVAVVVLAPVARRPHVDVSQAVATLQRKKTICERKLLLSFFERKLVKEN